MKRSHLLTVPMTCVLLLSIARDASAIPPFWEQFQAKYVKPDSDDEKVKKFSQLAAAPETGTCLVCHVKGKAKSERNRYGAALAELLSKNDFTKKRLDAEPEKAKKEIAAALEKVDAQKVDPENEDSATFGQLIARGLLPGVATEAEQAEPAEPDAKETNAETEQPAAQEPSRLEEAVASKAGASGQLATQLLARLKAELVAELKRELEPQIREQLRSELRAQLKDELKTELKDTLKAVVLAEVNAVGPVDAEVEGEAIKQIEKLGGTVMQLAQNDDSRTVAFHLTGKSLNDEGLGYLQSINKLVHLNLKDTQISDQGLAHIAHIPSLTWLNLARTQISDEGLKHLKGLDNITYMNLYGSQVTDAGLDHLKGMTNLRKLYLWQSKVTEEGAQKLQEQLPNCEVNY